MLWTWVTTHELDSTIEERPKNPKRPKKTGRAASTETIRHEKACNRDWSKGSTPRKYPTTISRSRRAKTSSTCRAYSLLTVPPCNRGNFTRTQNKWWRTLIWTDRHPSGNSVRAKHTPTLKSSQYLPSLARSRKLKTTRAPNEGSTRPKRSQGRPLRPTN